MRGYAAPPFMGSVILTAADLEKSFGVRPLFSGLAFTVSERDRIGLIGPNGAGKSTLLRIVAGALAPDAGTVATKRGLRVGYLEQVPSFAADATIESAVRDGANGAAEPGWEAEAAARALIAKLGLLEDGRTPETPVATLSGGWRKRVALARELGRSPDLLLLDEPTNHLDVEGIEWLEELLASTRFATITVTHDRVFLARVTTRILELDPRHDGGLLAVDGGYEAYLTARAETLAAQERREQVLSNTLRRETEWLRRGAAARTTKQQARIQRAQTLAEDVAELKVRNRSQSVDLGFAGADKRPKRLVEAKGISKRYGDRVLFQDETVLLVPGTRLGLLGANGTGKSTLIRVLVGQEEPDTGTVFRSPDLAVAYFAQHREELDPNTTVARTLAPSGDEVDFAGSRVHVRGYLERFLFRPEQADVPVSRLSGGEQSRLMIARLMLRPANLLVLDEPTNDLDSATLTVLEDSLTAFPGAVLLVTHDRYFMDQVTTQIVAFPNVAPGEPPEPLVRFGDVAQWESWQRERRAAARAQIKTQTAARAAGGAAARKLSYKDQRELDGMEERILTAEARVAALEAQLADPANASNGPRLVELGTEIGAARAAVDTLYARWEELEGKRQS